MTHVDSRLPFAAGLLLLAVLALATAKRPMRAQVTPITCATTGGIPCVLTGQYDNQRDAHNGNESTLVCPTSGRCTLSLQQVLMTSGSNPVTLFQVDPSVGGNDLPSILGGSQAQANPIYAQPLYVPGISVKSPASTTNCNNNTACNMLVAATLNGTLFAWNADTGTQLWSRQEGPAPLIQTHYGMMTALAPT